MPGSAPGLPPAPWELLRASLVLDWEAGASALPPYAAARQHGAVCRARGLETISSSSPHQLCDFTSRHWHSVRVSCYHQHLLVTKCHQQEDTIISSRHHTERPQMGFILITRKFIRNAESRASPPGPLYQSLHSSKMPRRFTHTVRFEDPAV